jgi:hypothetical protein
VTRCSLLTEFVGTPASSKREPAHVGDRSSSRRHFLERLRKSWRRSSRRVPYADGGWSASPRRRARRLNRMVRRASPAITIINQRPSLSWCK